MAELTIVPDPAPESSPVITNWDRWQSYTSGLSSPQNYIDWSWLYTVAASLQRRVWMGPEHQPCYPNMYVILVGAPGIGKGLSIREVCNFLKHWTLDQVMDAVKEIGKTAEEKAQIEMLAQANIERAQKAEFQGHVKGSDIIKAPLFPVCADAITYEALVQAVGESYRHINFYEWSEKAGKEVIRTYGHASLCFVLQELSSLLRKRTNDTVNYLLGLYDCPVDYEYVTMSRGKDRVRRGCLNIIAGTTPSFMQSTFDDKLMDEGFTSRTFYIFANKNRKNQFFIPPLTDEQKEHRTHLLNHIKNLSQLYGNVQVDEDTWAFLQDWWNEQEKNKHKRANKSLKLVPYYSRKNIHVMKVAMAMHFGESVLMKIPKQRFIEAIEFLDKEERNMHLAITLSGNNPQAKVSNRILELLQTGKKNYVDIVSETYTMIDTKGLNEALEFLELTRQIKKSTETDETTGDNVIYYSTI